MDLEKHEGRNRLIKAASRLEALRRQAADAKERLIGRAEEQLDSMAPAIRTAEDFVEADEGGGIYAHRRLRALHTEREALERVCARRHNEGG